MPGFARARRPVRGRRFEAASPISVIGLALSSGVLVELHFELSGFVILLRPCPDLFALRFDDLLHIPRLPLATVRKLADGALAQILASLLQ